MIKNEEDAKNCFLHSVVFALTKEEKMKLAKMLWYNGATIEELMRFCHLTRIEARKVIWS